jgi:hypothetical protein
MSGIRFTHSDYCSVISTDVARSRAFYAAALGLKEIPAPKEFDFVVIWYDLGGTYLRLLLKPQPDSISPRHFCLLTPDAAAARGHVTGLGVPIEETEKSAAADRFIVRDKDQSRTTLKIRAAERALLPDETVVLRRTNDPELQVNVLDGLPADVVNEVRLCSASLPRADGPG